MCLDAVVTISGHAGYLEIMFCLMQTICKSIFLSHYSWWASSSFLCYWIEDKRCCLKLQQTFMIKSSSRNAWALLIKKHYSEMTVTHLQTPWEGTCNSGRYILGCHISGQQRILYHHLPIKSTRCMSIIEKSWKKFTACTKIYDYLLFWCTVSRAWSNVLVSFFFTIGFIWLCW